MSIKILLADDQAMVRAGFRMILEMQDDMEVVGEASDGAETISVVKTLKPDIVLMDIQMPGMDGLEATRQIVHSRPRHARPWIVAMTANAMQGDREMCLQAGMDDYIAKPIRIEELVEALRKVQPLLEEEE